jgi:hypothetical protein
MHREDGAMFVGSKSLGYDTNVYWKEKELARDLVQRLLFEGNHTTLW